MRDEKALQALAERIRGEQIDQVKVGVFDLDGVLRGKYVSREKFLSALENGFGFCDVIFGWDTDDQLYDSGVQVTGWHTGFQDGWVQVDPATVRKLPQEPNTLLCLADFEAAPGSEPSPHSDVDGRTLLKRVLARASEMGFSAKAAFEYEFFLFEESPHSIRDKDYRNLRPITPGMFGYSVLRNSVNHEFFQALLRMGREMNFPIEGLHTETGPGVLEAALNYTDSLEAADRAALFKTWTKVLAQQWGWIATFMAKWSNDYPGQSGHLHVSLWDEQGSKNVFYDSQDPYRMSPLMNQFVAGLLALLPEWSVMLAPTVNSFTRLVKGAWAPVAACWGVDNRTAAIRVIPGNEHSQRFEHRVCGADANPYLALASVLAAGLHGIEQNLKLESALAVQGNAYDQDQDFPPLPADLEQAALAFQSSKAARQWFGEPFVDHFAATRLWEMQQFRKQVTDWELRRYFEII